MIDKKEQGRKNRRIGAAFERKTRKDLEHQGFIVDKWTNNVDLDKACIVPAKTNMYMSRSCGFPDFVAFMPTNIGERIGTKYNVILVECKSNGKLNKTEKLKMEWLKNEGLKCFVASPSEDGKSVEYKQPNSVFRKKLGN